MNIINRGFHDDNSVEFMFGHLINFLTRIVAIHIQRLKTRNQKNSAHKELSKLRERKTELTNSNEEISQCEIEAIAEREKELHCLRENEYLEVNLPDDDLTDLAISYEKIFNVFSLTIIYIFIKPIKLILVAVWNGSSLLLPLMYKEIRMYISEYIKKRKIRKEFSNYGSPVDDDFFTTA